MQKLSSVWSAGYLEGAVSEDFDFLADTSDDRSVTCR